MKLIQIRRFACAILFLLFAPLASVPAQNLATRRVAVGIQSPGYLAQAPGDDERLFVLERRRGIRIVKDGVLNQDLFLDISSELTNNEAATCFAFHPDYQNNGRFFILYMDRKLFTHLAEYKVSADPEVADPNSRIQILGPVLQPANVHNWNCIKFGPDGMLYVGIGDGVSNSNHTDNAAQDLGNLFGTILRLDMDLPAPYIPPDNPFVGQPGVDERIWVYGLRQPWRFEFDPLTDDLYIGEVGKVSWEEIDVLNAGTIAGKNMGWRCLEGDVCTNFTGGGCVECSNASYVPPVITYPHDDGRCAIIGGEVYRGSKISSLYGVYFYADFCTARFWSFKWDGSQVTEHVERTSELLPNLGGPIDFPTSFATDNEGEIYILSQAGGEIYKIIEEDCSVNSYCTSTLNSAGTMSTIGFHGSTRITNDDFFLTVDGAIPNKVGLFFYGPNQIQMPFGEGFRCVGGSIFRLNPASLADGTGSNQRAIDYANPPQSAGMITAGSTWNFQYWYRDATTPGLFNLSDGLEANFCP